jgi:serine phosphatase RsbU (regulator of sigma subunit)
MNDLQELTAVIEDLNQAGSFRDAAEHLTRWARTFTGCQSAILRLLQEDGGVPWLAGCVVDGADDAFARDETVVQGAECICGRVATGAVDTSLPFYTEGGSFTWGRIGTLAQDFTCDQLGRLRGRCMEELYESLAVFPLRAGSRMVGSLHLADKRPDRFVRSSEVVEAACRLAGHTLVRHKTREQEQAVLETIETALLPAVPPAVDGLDIGVCFTSATELAHVGGDFYDVLDLGEAGVLVLVGDVSGKGVDAAGLAARARYTIEAQADIASDLGAFMGAASEALTRQLPSGRFVTAVACLIDRQSGVVSTCSAGHPPPLLVTSSGAVELNAPHNPPLGIFPGRRFAAASQDLPAGDLLLIYTDGVTDSRRGDSFFGQDGVARTVKAMPGRDPQQIACSVCAASNDFHQSSLPGDDRLVVVVRRKTRLGRRSIGSA